MRLWSAQGSSGVHVEGDVQSGAEGVEARDVVLVGVGEEHLSDGGAFSGGQDRLDLGHGIDDGALVRGLVDQDEGVVGERPIGPQFEDSQVLVLEVRVHPAPRRVAASVPRAARRAECR